MFTSRPRSLLPLLALSVLLLGPLGCASDPGFPSSLYYRVRVTDPRGHFIADWVAQGFVRSTERGYRFRAVERQTAPPFPETIRYPLGRIVEANGPNILIQRCGEPLWHYYSRRAW